MERFLHAGRFSMASIYAPISFPPLPLIALRSSVGAGTAPAVAAVGSLKSIDPDRIILKKITLTGYSLLLNFWWWWPLWHRFFPLNVRIDWTWKHIWCSYPQRVSKLKASVRYMFHNPEDVKWFKVRISYHIFLICAVSYRSKILQSLLWICFLTCVVMAACGSVDQMWSTGSHQGASWYTR